jgi:predicted nucleic acid-binding protein
LVVRRNLIVADARYVVLASRLNAELLTDDFRLANTRYLRALHVRTLPSSAR